MFGGEYTELTISQFLLELVLRVVLDLD